MFILQDKIPEICTIDCECLHSFALKKITETLYQKKASMLPKHAAREKYSFFIILFLKNLHAFPEIFNWCCVVNEWRNKILNEWILVHPTLYMYVCYKLLVILFSLYTFKFLHCCRVRKPAWHCAALVSGDAWFL